MARPPRIQYPGAFYHIIVRGNQQQDIFQDDQDRIEYLNRVDLYKERRDFVLYAYVLMRNHVHLLIETPKEPISKIMQLINFTYTRYFNRKYGKVGHLFQGRYKSYLCDRDEYLLALVRYIHLNPVRAGAVKTPDQYPWSSHTEYLGKRRGAVDTARVLRLFSEKPVQARRLYLEFISEALKTGREEAYYRAVEQQIVGNEEFVEAVERRIKDPERRIPKPTVSRISRAIEQQTGVGLAEIVSRSRREEVVFARGMLVSVWREAGRKLTELKPVLKRDLSMLSKLSRLGETPEGQKATDAVIKKLKS